MTTTFWVYGPALTIGEAVFWALWSLLATLFTTAFTLDKYRSIRKTRRTR